MHDTLVPWDYYYRSENKNFLKNLFNNISIYTYQ